MQGQASRLMAQPLIMSSICIEYTHERGIGPQKSKEGPSKPAPLKLSWSGLVELIPENCIQPSYSLRLSTFMNN